MSRSLTIFTVLLIAIAVGHGQGQVQADQRAQELPQLFEQLQISANQSEARELESQIWQHWLDAPDNRAQSLMKEVIQALSGSDFAVALELCDQLVELYPNYAEAWNKRATIHYLMGDHLASVADIRETIALEPKHFGAISGLGMIFMREQNFTAALDAFEKVLEISPASTAIQQRVARLRKTLEREI